ncbi:MAG: hypothetical protein JWM53_3974 [bacterium]|nr:hypothetical protein [bacterium]
MDRVLATVALALVAGCSSSAPARLVAGAAIFGGVSFAQKWVAVMTRTSRLVTGGHHGVLEAVPTAGGTPLTLDEHSNGGVFNRGTTLWYQGGVTVVNEGTPPSEHVYGGLYVWSPSLAAPVKVGDDVREYYPSQDGSACVFMDWAQPTLAAANTGTLYAVAAASCASGACDKIELARDVTLAQTAWRIASDGKVVLATVRGATATDAGKVLLASPASGQVQLLSSGVDARSPMIAPSGATLAWVEGANEIHSMTGETPAVLTPTSPLVDGASMIAADDFVAKTRELATGPAALARVTGSGTTLLPVQKPQQFFVSQAVAGKTDRYVFFSLATIAANGEPDLWMLDLATPGAQPVALAGAVENGIGAAVAFSDDGSVAHFFDNFDPVTRRGDEFVVPLAMPTRTLVAVGVHNAAFIPGTTRLLYINAPDANSGAGVLTLLPSPSPSAQPAVQGVGVVNFGDSRQPPARTWYTQATGASDDGVWYMPQP